MTHRITRTLATLAIGAVLALGAPAAQAQQINPTANSVTEDTLLEALQGDQQIGGRISIPDDRAAGLIKPGNKDWALTHNGTVRTLTIVSLLGMLALLVLFYLVRGRIRIDSGLSGRKITRFTPVERFAHWLMAGAFIVLALTGLNLILGRALILPLFGADGFASMSAWGKLAHNYVGWAFMLGLLLAFLLWVAHNIPNKIDAAWLRAGGGLLKKGVHPPAKKFNAGQKLVFWLVVLGGAALSFTGVMMLFPAIAGSQADWQLYQLIHGVVAAVLVAVTLAHVYIGSIGMEGAFDAMGTGEVDLNWAKEHHSLWVEEVGAAQTDAPRTRAHPAE